MAGEVSETRVPGLDRPACPLRDDERLPRAQGEPLPVHLDDACARHPDEEHLDLRIDVATDAFPRREADEVGVQVVACVGPDWPLDRAGTGQARQIDYPRRAVPLSLCHPYLVHSRPSARSIPPRTPT